MYSTLRHVRCVSPTLVYAMMVVIVSVNSVVVVDIIADVDVVVHLRVRALKALAKMRKSLGMLFRHNINNTIHLYTYLVKPILTYCSDYWGCLQPKIIQ